MGGLAYYWYLVLVYRSGESVEGWYMVILMMMMLMMILWVVIALPIISV